MQINSFNSGDMLRMAAFSSHFRNHQYRRFFNGYQFSNLAIIPLN